MKTPIRTCAGCGAKRPKSKMIRVGPDDEGKTALTGPGKHAGRGAYVCVDTGCLGKAKQSRALSRALQRDIEGDVYELLELEIGDRQKGRSG